MTNIPDRSALARMKKLTEEIKVCMMTTMTPEGRLMSRPMTTLEVDSDGFLWFLTSEESEQTVALDMDENVNLTYVGPDGSRYLSITGSGTEVKDRARIDALWSPAIAAWFPEGKDDPLLCLIKVHVLSAEYWDGPTGRVDQFYGVAPTLVKGTRYEAGTQKPEYS